MCLFFFPLFQTLTNAGSDETSARLSSIHSKAENDVLNLKFILEMAHDLLSVLIIEENVDTIKENIENLDQEGRSAYLSKKAKKYEAWQRDIKIELNDFIKPIIARMSIDVATIKSITSASYDVDVDHREHQDHEGHLHSPEDRLKHANQLIRNIERETKNAIGRLVLDLGRNADSIENPVQPFQDDWRNHHSARLHATPGDPHLALCERYQHIHKMNDIPKDLIAVFQWTADHLTFTLEQQMQGDDDPLSHLESTLKWQRNRIADVLVNTEKAVTAAHASSCHKPNVQGSLFEILKVGHNLYRDRIQEAIVSFMFGMRAVSDFYYLYIL